VDLADYIRVVRKRWRVIAVTVLIAIAIAAVQTLLSTKIYTASTQVFVSTSGGSDTAQLLQGSSFTQQRVKSYAEIVTTPVVLDPVIDNLGLTMTADQLATHITATAPVDTVLIDIAVRDTDPAQAARIADDVGKQFAKTVTDLESVSGQTSSPVKVSVVREPQVPTSPVSPRPVRNLGIGLVLGLLVGLGLALLRDLLDTTIKGEADCKPVTDATVIGSIGFDSDAKAHPLIVQVDPHGARSEAFRALRTNLKFVDAANHLNSITFTSSLPDEGKTTTTANLAITMAATGARVCVIEGDLRRPRLLTYLGLEGSVGLTDVLIGQTDVSDVLQQFGTDGLFVLGAGPIPPNPSELLGSEAMRETIRKLESEFDIVIIDAPPLLPVTDAAVVATITGGTVLVVGAGLVNREQLRRAIGTLESVGGNLLGLVLNRLPATSSDAYSYYSSGYRPDVPVADAKPGRFGRRHNKDKQPTPVG
jgi:succinoglycan biosynthesis transport protein ExoP